MPGHISSVRSHAASPPRGGEFELRAIFEVLRRRRGIIVGTVLVFTGAAAMLSMNLTPWYTAESTIVVEPRDTRLINFDQMQQRQELLNDAEMLNTHVKILTSNSFVHRVIEELDLLKSPEFNFTMRHQDTLDDSDELAPYDFRHLASETLSWIRRHLVAIGFAEESSAGGSYRPVDGEISEDQERLGPKRLAIPGVSPTEDAKANNTPAADVIASAVELGADRRFGPGQTVREGEEGASEWGTVRMVELSQDPAAEDSVDKTVMATATESLLEQLGVSPITRSYAIEVAFTSINPETAAQVANAMTELYVEYQLGAKRIATNGALDWLAQRLDKLRAQLVKAEQAAESFREENELLASGRGLAFSEQELAALSHELIVSGAERLAIEAKLDRIRQVRSSGDSLEAVSEVMLSPVIADLREEEMLLLRQEAQLRQEYGPRHPKIIQIEADKDNLSARIDVEIQNITGALANDIATAQVREDTLQAKLEDAKAASIRGKRAEIQLRLLEREADSTRTLYSTLLSRFKELTEQRDLLEPGVRVISTAAVPADPSFPQVKLMTGAGFMGSLMVAVLLAFAVDQLDRGLRTGRQAEQLLNLPQIGFVPKLGRTIRRRGAHRYLAEKATSAYAEAIRGVQTALYFSNVDQPPQVVLVTSSVPAEGKTTLVLSLATLLAQSGGKTAAVDLDLRRPTLGRALRKSGNGDLVDYMKGQGTLDDIAHQVDEVDNLHIIPARRLTGSPTDLLASQRMANLIAELRTRYQYIVLDSPPLLGMSDSRFAAALADAVVFVVRWSKTGEEMALKALDNLRESDARIAGAVLTQVNVRRHRKYAPEDVVHHYGAYRKYYVN